MRWKAARFRSPCFLRVFLATGKSASGFGKATAPTSRSFRPARPTQGISTARQTTTVCRGACRCWWTTRASTTKLFRSRSCGYTWRCRMRPATTRPRSLCRRSFTALRRSALAARTTRAWSGSKSDPSGFQWTMKLQRLSPIGDHGSASPISPLRMSGQTRCRLKSSKAGSP